MQYNVYAKITNLFTDLYKKVKNKLYHYINKAFYL